MAAQHRTETRNVTDLFDIERAKTGRTYPAGAVLIQLSASDGQVHYQRTTGEVSTQYAVLMPQQPQWSRYLYECVKRVWPAHYARTNQGINYPYTALLQLRVPVHTDDEDRATLVQLAEQFDAELRQERETIEILKGVKKAHLGLMFPG